MGTDLGLLQPYWLMLLPLPLVWLFVRRRHPRAWPTLLPPPSMRYPLLAVLGADAVRHDATRYPGADRLVAIALVLMVIALAQPVRYAGTVEPARDSEPVDLVIVAGTAISMTLRDYRVEGERIDRMTLTRRLLDRFVEGFRGRRVGLVVLGNPPARWLPLTTDKRVVRDAIARLRTTLGGRLSDTGAALALVNEDFGGNAGQVVVLVTDGGLQLGATSPQAAARKLAAEGNTLYVIGIGADDPAEYGGDVGGLIYEPIDPVFLTELAEAGGGLFFPARDVDTFNAALSVIESRHRRPAMASPGRRLVEPWYPLPLGVAMLLLLVAGLRPGAGRKRTAGAGK